MGGGGRGQGGPDGLQAVGEEEEVAIAIDQLPAVASSSSSSAVARDQSIND